MKKDVKSSAALDVSAEAIGYAVREGAPVNLTQASLELEAEWARLQGTARQQPATPEDEAEEQARTTAKVMAALHHYVNVQPRSDRQGAQHRAPQGSALKKKK